MGMLNLLLAMGFRDFVGTVFAIESDKAKHRFPTKYAKRRIDCLFAHVNALQETTAPCVWHGGDGGVVSTGKCDMAILGPPCTPYTRRAGKRAADVKNHKQFKCLWGPVLDWLKGGKRPHGGILEEVAAFDHKSPRQDRSMLSDTTPICFLCSGLPRVGHPSDS